MLCKFSINLSTLKKCREPQRFPNSLDAYWMVNYWCCSSHIYTIRTIHLIDIHLTDIRLIDIRSVPPIRLRTTALVYVTKPRSIDIQLPTVNRYVPYKHTLIYKLISGFGDSLSGVIVTKTGDQCRHPNQWVFVRYVLFLYHIFSVYICSDICHNWGLERTRTNWLIIICLWFERWCLLYRTAWWSAGRLQFGNNNEMQFINETKRKQQVLTKWGCGVCRLASRLLSLVRHPTFPYFR